ncbi:MAG TPA: YggS family pyridoxal phosphate-dependent enzyme, partial [Smithellaceae bacterium]|nr:YggS family pyridoxal phosphate-dependent enzyme [Smithellaceae bacterium]
METDISSNVSLIRQRMEVACSRCGRDPRSVRLMAVSKTVAPERIRQALDAGVTLLGENYVQEAREKIP